MNPYTYWHKATPDAWSRGDLTPGQRVEVLRDGIETYGILVGHLGETVDGLLFWEPSRGYLARSWFCSTLMQFRIPLSPPSLERPIRLERLSAGVSSLGGRMTRWHYHCPCGHSGTINQDKRGCVADALDHLRDAHGLPRDKRYLR